MKQELEERIKCEAANRVGKIIPADKKAAFEDLENVAEAAYCHFRSTFLQIRFVRLRNAGVAGCHSLDVSRRSSVELNHGTLSEIKAVLGEEIELAQRLHAVMLRDSRIGFEASNHYYYTVNDLKEKVLNCRNDCGTGSSSDALNNI